MTVTVLAEASSGWTLDPLQLASPLLLAAGYAIRVRELSRRGRAVPAARRASFYAGVVILALAVTSPVDTVGETRLFWVHMTQHLMLGDLAPLGIVIGVTGPVLRPLLAARPIQRLRALAHPLVAFPLWTANLYLWHLTPLYEGALAHPLAHALEHLLFFTTGALMWAAVIEPLPGPVWFGNGWKAVYVLGVRTVQGVLANVFLWSGHAFYHRYVAGEHAAGVTPGQDQAIGGGIMLVEGALVTAAVFAWLFLRWTRETELRQRLIDAGNDPAAAARAARYGRSALARRPPG
jgi:cytochrome c oxidase assembly factor CtaG